MNTTIKKGWREAKFGDLFSIKHGYAFKGQFFSDAGSYIVLTPGNFYDEGGFKKKDKEKYYIGEVREDFILGKNDLIIAMTEQAEGLLGSSVIIPDSNLYLHNQRLGLIENLKKDDLDKGYLYYLFNTWSVRSQIRATANGAKVRHTSPSRIYEVQITLPPLPTQRKIADILSAYDDLIENNTRRIKILEEMAQLIYREWFVNFRFPGHEQIKMVDSELGKIPEGWEVPTIGDISSYINRGIAPKYDEQSDSIVINQRCIRDNRLNLDIARRHSKKVPPEKFVRFGDVLINSTGVGTLGRVTQVYKDIPDCSVDTHVTIVRPGETVTIDYFGLSLFNLQPNFESLGAGTTGQTELSRGSIGEVNLILPPKYLQDTFAEIVSPMRLNIVNVLAKNENLRQTRDLLLPKLISGEIDVESLKVGIGPEDDEPWQ